MQSFFSQKTSIKIHSTRNINNIKIFKDILYKYLYEISPSILPKITFFSSNLRKFPLSFNIKKNFLFDKKFKNELVILFKLADGSNVLLYRFIYFYQIIEYFIKKGEDGREVDALISIIKKYISIEATNILLFNHQRDNSLVDYFKKNTIPFSMNKNKINFKNKNMEVELTNLSKRIYAVRNAVVHNKEEEKGYTPFKDDAVLEKECILLEIIARQLIENSAEKINSHLHGNEA